MKVAGSLATQFAPPFSLVLHFFIGGVIFGFISVLFLFAFSDGFEPPFYAFTYASAVHMFLLGFVLMIIFGALYQLIPVALEIPIYSFTLGYIQFYIYLVGIILFSFSLYSGNIVSFGVVGSALIYISILLFVFNFFVSLRKLEKLNITSKFLILGVIFLTVGISIGIFIVFEFATGQFFADTYRLIIAHIIFSLFGFVFMVIMGVAYVLLPMFSLSHKFNDIYLNTGFFVMVVSVFGGGISVILFENPAVMYSVFLLILSGVFLYLAQVVEIYTKRMRKIKDVGIDTMFYSHFYLVIFIFSSVLIPFFEKAIFFTGFILLFGFLSTLIYGSMYKIIPFLTWFHRFSPLVGKKKVPMLNQMLPEKLPDYQIAVYTIGTMLTALSILMEIKLFYVAGVVLMLFGMFLFIYVIYYVLRFKVEE